MIVEEFGNSVEPILEKLCEYESFDEATPLPPSTCWDLLSPKPCRGSLPGLRMSPGHQRMWRSSEAWLRSQPRVTARVSPHEAWDFLRTVLAADPEDAEMEGFFGCCFRRGNAWGCLPFF